jgi:small multidrug resistance pump
LPILSEVVATSALKAAESFSRWFPSLLVVTGYGLAFHFLSLTLRAIPLSIAYAIWSGVDVALVSLVGWAIYHQSLDFGALVGIALIVAGVVVPILKSSATLMAYGRTSKPTS